jgi:hemerythrin
MTEPTPSASELRLGDARTDATHLEMLEIVRDVRLASGASKEARYFELVAHTAEHFAQEERWMLATGIDAGHCHFNQHADVLQVLKEVERLTRAGDTQYIDRATDALLEWFVPHALSMDAGLVTHLQQQGFDTATEMLVAPENMAASAAV